MLLLHLCILSRSSHAPLVPSAKQQKFTPNTVVSGRKTECKSMLVMLNIAIWPQFYARLPVCGGKCLQLPHTNASESHTRTAQQINDHISNGAKAHRVHGTIYYPRMYNKYTDERARSLAHSLAAIRSHMTITHAHTHGCLVYRTTDTLIHI